MREIKFRAWNIKLSKMWDMDGLGYNMFDNIKNDELISSQGICKLMQYTGFKDKNKKEIYKSDLVKIDGLVCEVEWYGGAWVVHYFMGERYTYLSHFDETDIEVIGNTYQNKELLD
jgi:uncharacterized phage protein (TIGR01671 family)